jgi:hypothetical protein
VAVWVRPVAGRGPAPSLEFEVGGRFRDRRLNDRVKPAIMDRNRKVISSSPVLFMAHFKSRYLGVIVVKDNVVEVRDHEITWVK